MRYPAHLRRNKSGLLHLRLTVPNDLRPVLARREIKRSLNIRDTALAHRWALALTTRFGIHFEEFWFMVRRGYDPKNFDPTNPATWPTREGVVGEYKMRFNAHTGEIDIESDPNVPGDHKNAMEAMRETVKEAKALYESPVLLDQMKLAQQKREAEEQMFMALTDPKVRALPDEVAMRVAEAMQPKSALTVPATLKAAASQYRASLVGMDERTINDYLCAVDWFVRGLGEDLQVSAIDEVRVNAWKSEVLDHYTGIREKKQAKKVTQGHLTVDPVAGLPQVAPKRSCAVPASWPRSAASDFPPTRKPNPQPNPNAPHHDQHCQPHHPRPMPALFPRPHPLAAGWMGVGKVDAEAPQNSPQTDPVPALDAPAHPASAADGFMRRDL